ncbi:protein of unknown function [Stenotrophomonas maltophilia]|nr:protein of unknown function [Stenotrophomonas maltophilia]
MAGVPGGRGLKGRQYTGVGGRALNGQPPDPAQPLTSR